MHPALRLLSIGLALLLLAATLPAHAAASLPAPTIESASASVEIVNGTAFTEVRRVLSNPTEDDVWLEIHTAYPAGALVSRLALFSPTGLLLEQATPSRANDSAAPPGAPQWLAHAEGAFVPASSYGASRDLALAVRTPGYGTVELVVAFAEVLRPTRGQYRYALPLSTLGPSSNVTFDARVSMAASITQIDVSLPALASVAGTGARNASVSASFPLPAPSGALHLNFSMAPTGAHGAVASCMGAEGGFFAYTFYPGSVDLSLDPLPKSVSFAVDFSGSMAGRKADQAKAAFTSILGQLAAYDRFEVLRFDSTVYALTPGFVDATPEATASAAERLNRAAPSGLTNIGAALDRALSDLSNESHTLPMLVLLTDGQPTVGTKDYGELVALAADRNRVGAAIHTISLGSEAADELLSTLSAATYGTHRLVDPESDIAAEISDFYTQVSEPLIEDLAFTFSEPAHTVSVPPVGILYGGSDVTARGRIAPPGGTVFVTIEGRSSKGQFSVTDSFAPDRLPCADLERSWAIARIMELAAAADAQGATADLVENITALALAYGYATAYTPLVLASGASIRTALPAAPPTPPPPQPEGTFTPGADLAFPPYALALAAIAVAFAALALLLRSRRPRDGEGP
jgi:hypothetical protein